MNYLQQKKQALTSQIQQGILPFGYMQVEYLESIGTQYINTGIVPDSNTGFKIKMSANDVISDIYYLGCRESDNTDSRFVIGVYNGYVYYGYGTTFADNANWRPKSYEVFTGTMNYYNDKKGTYNGLYPKKAKQQTIPTITKTIWLFISNSLQPVGKRIVRVYDFEITQDDELLAHYIPCLDNNNRPCMYDTISKKTFYNQGTGEFLYGEVIN